MRLAPLVAFMVAVAYWGWVYAQEVPTEALGGACVAVVSQDSHSDPKGGFAPLCGPEACLDPGNGGGGSGGSGCNRVCLWLCRTSCSYVSKRVCEPLPPRYELVCRIISVPVCQEYCN